MKKKFSKKLALNKETISILQSDEMKLIRGATFFFGTCDCDTASCSIYVQCCDPPPKYPLNNEGQG